MLRGERRAYRRGTATGHLSTRHDLTSFLLFPRRLPSSETRRPNRRSKLGGGGEKGGGSLFLANHKRKRSISCQVTRDSSKQESIWFPRTEIHTFPMDSNEARIVSSSSTRHFEKDGRRSSRRKTRFARKICEAVAGYANYDCLPSPADSRGGRRRRVSVHWTCYYFHVATEEETEVCATVAEETAAKLETRRFAGFQNFGCWDFEDRGGGRRFATRSEFWKDKGGVEGRGEVSAIVWRLINLG